MLRNVVMGIALVASASTALPSVAMARDHGRHGHHDHDDDDDDNRGRRHYRERDYYNERYAEPRRYYSDNQPRYRCKTEGTTGLIIGGAAGALLGRAVDTRGDRALGTILGAGAGALLGREVAQKRRC